MTAVHPKKILLAFAGSRGDAQPGVLLGRELLGRGHDVTVAVSPNLVEFASRHGVPAVPFGLDSDELLRAQRDDQRFRQLNPVQRVRAVLDLQRRGFGESARDLLAVARGHDIVVTGMACEEVAVEVARHHDIPVAAVHFFPIRPNRSVPVVAAGWGHRIPGPLNRLGWRALTAARARALAPEVAALPWATAAAGRVGVLGAQGYTAIQAYDPELFPGLANHLPGAVFTGFPVPIDDGVPAIARGAAAPRDGSIERAFGLDAELAEWIIAGPAPVYAGLGSMPVADPVAVEAMVREAGRRLGLRVLLVGPMFRGRIGAELAVVDQVDHRAVLPLCAAAVHHGGAGTTAAALRAGVPSVICSVQADQPYWGRQVESLGLGATAPFAGLTANRLERLLIRATEPDVRLRATAYGARFRDDGVRRAADVVESLAPDTAARDAAELTAATIGGVR
ncbi:glycosyltransferase [Nocardia tengchongensis]|uniref:glycosyltransferase n=1 Tax=Nocardia tengchongensis TaxID=2055889 RepID=UPI001FE4AC4B|nr:glycosyltransferase [Nocardia tengchongensis]